MPMSPVVRGLAEVYVNTGANNTYELLGLTRNGVTFTRQVYQMPVPCDSHGGDEGTPLDMIFLDMIIRIDCELTTFDDAVRQKIAAMTKRQQGETFNTLPVPGTLMFLGNRFFGVKIQSNPADRADGKIVVFTFPRCLITNDPFTDNFGRRYTTLHFLATAYRDPLTNTLWTEELITP